MTCSIITTCKGRLHHLQQSLPAMLRQDSEDYDVIVVSYGDPDKCHDRLSNYMRDHGNLRFVVVTESDAPTYNRSIANNVGSIYATGDILCFVDSDVVLESGWLGYVASEIRGAPENKLVLRGTYPCPRNSPAFGTNGTCAVAAKYFHEVCGFCEELRGYGYDDTDLYRRCQTVGCQLRSYPTHLLRHIPHDSKERTKFHDCSGRKNRRIAAVATPDPNYGRNIPSYELRK